MDAVVQGVAVLIVAYFVVPLLEVSVHAFRAPAVRLQLENERLATTVSELTAQKNQLERDVARQRSLATLNEELAMVIGAFHSAISIAAHDGWSDDGQRHVEATRGAACEWIASRIGPVEKQLFLAATPVPYIYTAVPEARRGQWQKLVGQLEYLKTLNALLDSRFTNSPTET